MDKVDTYISESTEIQKALSFLMFFDDVPKGHDKEVLDFMNSMIPDNDTEMCVLADIFVSDEHRVHLMRTISISLPYWLNIQKRLNNLKTMSINNAQ